MSDASRARRIIEQADDEILQTRRLLHAAALARLLGVSAETIRAGIRSGKIPALQTPGGHYRITAATCSKLLAERKKVAEAADGPF